jgi:hypothetical protein
VTIGDWGATLPGVRWMVGWENPTGPQTINADFGSATRDCNATLDGDGNGVPTDDGKNWAYAAYDTQTCAMDFTRLAWDAAYPVRYTDFAHLRPTRIVPGTLFFDGNGNGQCDTLPGVKPPCFDLDGNGRLDPTEDYVVSGLPAYAPVTPGDSLKVFWSPGILAAARAKGLFGASWPAHVATPEMAQTYWDLRDATKHYAVLGATRPDFAALLVYRKGDHVQAEDDHAHVRQAYDGFRNHGLWCRLNPDSAYYAYLATLPAGYAETPANAVVAGADMKAHAEPNTVDLNTFDIAGACEMADRVHYGVWDADLHRVIIPDTAVSVGGPVVPGGPAALRVEVLGLVGADRVLRVRLAGVRAGEPVRATLHDAAGREVWRAEVEGDRTPRVIEWRIEGCRLPAGLYWLRARQGGSVSAGARVVVVR